MLEGSKELTIIDFKKSNSRKVVGAKFLFWPAAAAFDDPLLS